MKCNNTFVIAILLLLCFLSHPAASDEDTVTINLDEKIVDEEENLTSKEATCENETTTIAEPLREIVSDEIGTDTFTIRSEVDDFHETVLQLESQSSPSKEFQFLKFQSRGETVLEVDWRRYLGNKRCQDCSTLETYSIITIHEKWKI